VIDYQKILSPVVTEIKPSGIRKFFDIANTMEDVISLGVGEPDFPTPWAIRKAGINSLDGGKTRYSSNWGLLQLREEIARYVNRKYNLTYNPKDEVLVTVGGSEAIDMTMRAVIVPGDEVIIPQPSYVCYEPIARLCGATPVIIETKAENNFKVTPEELKNALSDKTKLLILPYPCNPTGGIMEKSDLEALANILKDTNVLVLSDEIYAELTFGGVRHTSIASIDGMWERTIVVNGFSKTFSMTGWRLGYACGPSPLLKQITKIHQFAIMCAPTTSQYAAIEALKNGDEAVASMHEEYDMRRRFIVAGFNKIGLECKEPKGAFYVFPSIQSTGLSSDDFCEQLLYNKKVAVVPGTAFGKGGEGFIRVSYCYSLDHIKEALKRIEEFLKEIKK